MAGNTSKMPVIRPRTGADLDRIVEIDTLVLGKSRPEYWEMKLELAEKRLPIASLMAEMDGKVVGFIMGDASGWEYGVPEHEGWIDTIGVDPAYQRRGVAGELLNEMVWHLKKVGGDTAYTLVNWREGGLLRLFEAVGFSKGEMINLELKLT